MKKFIVIITALTFSCCVYGQRIVVGETTATPHEAYTPSFKNDGKNTKVKNVILMIGDGMGVGAVYSGMYANGGYLTLTNLHTIGFTRTQSANDFTTDSAASGSAYACGQKTNNYAIGMDVNGEAMANIPEVLTPLGYACGVVSTDNLDGATPAAFFAHQANRTMEDEIWGDLPSSSLVFAAAGTRDRFEKRPKEIQDAINDSFTVVNTLEDAALIGNAERLCYLPESVDQTRGEEWLSETTEQAIDFLSKSGKKGFFLMVEGARIDKQSHKNNYEGCVWEMLDFDKAVEAAIRFAEKDGHTLVVISADHETGGLSLIDGNPAENTVKGVYVVGSHTPAMVPLFAYGPKSGIFACAQENSDVSNKILKVLGARK